LQEKCYIQIPHAPNSMSLSHQITLRSVSIPKSVQNIIIDSKIINETGILNDTYINLDKLSFKIDRMFFNAKANIKISPKMP
jgi:hypothetical protein